MNINTLYSNKLTWVAVGISNFSAKVGASPLELVLVLGCSDPV